MAYLQEIKIVQKEDAPVIGSTQQPNTIWIVNLYDKVCDMYASDNNGIVGIVSEQLQLFESVEEALLGVPIPFRKNGKTVLIKSTISREIPELDENGDPILDEDGEPIMVTETMEYYREYWWIDGIQDDDLILKAPDLQAVTANGATIHPGKKLTFLPTSSPVVPDGWLVTESNMEIWAGEDAKSIIMNSGMPNRIEGEQFYSHVIIGIGAGKNYEKGWGTIAIGSNSLNKTKTANTTQAMGPHALEDFEGVSETMDYYDFGAGWGKAHANMAIGYWAGKGLKEGHSNLYIGNTIGNRPAEEKGKLIIHMHKAPGQGPANLESSHSHAKYPLISGDFIERWLNIAGKFRITKHHNSIETEVGDIENVAMLKSLTNYHEVTPVKSTTMVLDAIKKMTESEKSELKTALGLTE